MLITPNLASPPPAQAPANASARPADNGFARLLDREQTRPAQREPETAKDHHAEAAPEAATPTHTNADGAGVPDTRSARSHAAREPGTTRPTKPTAAKKSDAEPADGKDAKSGKADEAAADTPGAADPALAHWLANLHLPPAAPAEAAAAGAAAMVSAPAGKAVTALAGAAAGEVAATRPDASSALSDRKGASTQAATHRDGHADKTSMPAVLEAVEGSAPVAGDKAAADTAATPAPAPAGARGFEAAAAALTAAPAAEATHAAAAPAPVTVLLPAALDSAEFAQAFGVQVSVLARDGVQHAELQLNPVETGPVSVQIVLEGTQARIDFGADAAGTRQAIEHSLPELAAALREAGLTLSGGGVSQHAQGRGDGARGRGEGQPDAPRTRSEAAAAPVQRWHGSVSATGVDLYA